MKLLLLNDLKNVTTLFLLFIVLISLKPCSDEPVCSDDLFTATNYKAADCETPPLEDCTPICICTCCGQRIIVAKETQFEIEGNTFSIENTTTPNSFLIAQRAQNIWQPPKIA